MFLFTQNVFNSGEERYRIQAQVGRDIQHFLHEDRKSTNCVFIYSIFDFKLKHLEMFLNVHLSSSFFIRKISNGNKKEIYTHSLYNNLANSIDNSKRHGVVYIARHYNRVL